MRIEFARLNQAELIAEVGDRVVLADGFTHEHMVEPVQLREVPCRIEWNVERQGYTGWALLDEQGRVLYVGDVHWVWPGDTYSLEVPDRGSRS